MLDACCTAHKVEKQQAVTNEVCANMRPTSPASAGSVTPGKALRVECTTWSRDSHGLFDYEARHMNVRHFLVSRAARLFRVGAHVECVPESAPIPTAAPAAATATTQLAEAAESAAAAGEQQPEVPQTTDFLLSIRCSRDGKYVVMPADRSATGAAPAVVTPQKLWSIVREQNDNKHVLQENDVIKLGRYKLRVKQLVAQSSKREDDSSAPTEVPDLRLDDGDPPLSFVASDDMQCRICLLEGNQANDPLISPCDCKGSIRFVHLECLRHWINGRLNFHEQLHKPIFVKQLLCELCKIPYPTAISYNNERMQVVTVPKTEPPFLVLENMVGSHQKGVHVISMSSKKDLKLGRGHESDVRIPDVSISRYHATIRFVDGNFQLEDHNSKFGTLVSLRKAFAIGDTVAALQVGRSVVKLSVDSAPASQDGIVEVSEVIPDPAHFPEVPERFSEQPGTENSEQQQQQPQQQQPQQQQDSQQQQQQHRHEEALALFPMHQGHQDEPVAIDHQRPLFLSPVQRQMIQQQLERDAAARARQHYYDHVVRFSALAAGGPMGCPVRAPPLPDSAAAGADEPACAAASTAAAAASPAAPFQALMQEHLQQFARIPSPVFEIWNMGYAGGAGLGAPHSPALPYPQEEVAADTERKAIRTAGGGAEADAQGGDEGEGSSDGSTPQEMDIETDIRARGRFAERVAML